MKFEYTAINKQQNLIDGIIEADNEESALSTIRRLGHRPLTVKKQKISILNLSIGKEKVKLDEMTIFTRQLSVMIGASVPLLRALESLSGKGETALQKIIKKVIIQIEGGSTFADALEKFPDVFDNIFVNMIRAGESAGILEDILKRLALQQEKSATIRKKIKSAMTYPMVLLFITVAAFFGLMIFVIPQLGSILTSFGGEDAKLPTITQFMMNLSKFIIDFWYIIFPMMIGTIIGILKYIKTPKGKPKFDALILKTPGVNSIVLKTIVANFSRTFSALMGSGVSVINALEISSKAVGNSVYENALKEAIKEVKNGKQLSSILIKQGKIWPDIVPQMLAVGEETGSTETILLKVADFYEEEVDLAIESINSIIEPVMIVIMGGMVGAIAASVMSPIANMTKTIKE